MPEKVIEHICYEGRIMGGPFDDHVIKVSAHREGRKYTPDVGVMGPDGMFLPANPLEIPSATLRTAKETPNAALDCAFKSLYFYLNNEVAAARLADVHEASKHYVLLDDMGKRDYEAMPDFDTDAYEEFQNEEFDYLPPNSEALIDAGLMEIGQSADVSFDDSVDDASSISGQAKGTEEEAEGVGPEDTSTVDGNEAADNGLQNFLGSTANIKPEKSATQATGTGERG